MTVRVDVKPELLRWACERSGLDVAALAGRFPYLEAWTRGEVKPTLKQLESLAKATHTVEPGVRWQREWKLIEGDYEVNQGSFTLLPWADGKTLAIYRIEAKPKIPVPEWMMRKAQADRLPELMHRLRKQAGSP